MLRSVSGAVSIDFMGPGLALVLLTLGIARWRAGPENAEGATRSAFIRPIVLAAVALVVFGIGIYLPIGAAAGRYTMPAVWGLDLLIAALLTALADVPRGAWRRTAHAAFGCGLAVVLAANVGKQGRFAARADLLWQALECVEREVPTDTCVAWPGRPGEIAPSQELEWAEGIHFGWHLQARRRPDIALHFDDDSGPAAPVFALTGRNQPPEGDWQLLHEFSSPYWLGRRCYHCYLWERGPATTMHSVRASREDMP
jgi:hypothetical protein